MKNLFISASLFAAGVWYFHHVSEYRAHPAQPEEPVRGEIVIAGAPDGTLQGRWQNASPSPVGRK